MWDFDSLTVIIPACGTGERFKRAGYTGPKHLVPVAGKPMIQHVIDALPKVRRIIVAVRNEHHEQTVNAVGDKVDAVIVPTNTKNILETLKTPLMIWDCGPVMVVNCDNVIDFRDPEFYHPLNGVGSGYGVVLVEVMNDPLKKDSPYSHAETDLSDSGVWKITRVAEKKNISHLACAGAFMFADEDILMSAIDIKLSGPPDHKGEHYLAPIFNIFIGAGIEVEAINIRPWSLISMGEPEDIPEAERKLNAIR